MFSAELERGRQHCTSTFTLSVFDTKYLFLPEAMLCSLSVCVYYEYIFRKHKNSIILSFIQLLIEQ